VHTARSYALAALVALLVPAAAARAQDGGELVQLDFNDVELNVVIDTIAQMTGRNFIYDDKVRGRVTIVSPTKITVDQAFAVFESVLQVKGFTTVEGPGGVLKIIPIREAKESSIETVESRRRPPKTDRFVTRLIPLRYIDAEDITNTLKPLVSKEAAMVAYPPTNTVILTDSASNIRRILSIIDAIDVETYREELSVFKIRHADAATLAQHIAEIYGGEVSSASPTPPRGRARRAAARRAARQAVAAAEAVSKGAARIITDARTNSLIVMASRARTEDIRRLIAQLDIPVTGGGRIHVHYLKHADAEEMAQTLNSLISGQPAAPGAGGATGRGAAATQALRAAVTELAEGVTITPDPPTNSLVIQASQEGYATLAHVIEQLDIERPQVLVEALIMEVDVTDGEELGFNGIARIFRQNGNLGIGSLSDTGARPGSFIARPTTAEGNTFGTGVGNRIAPDVFPEALANLIATAGRSTLSVSPSGLVTGTLIQGLIRASASDNGTNILSAPHILTSDNEEAEIQVGANIPIITSRVQSAAGVEQATADLATSVNIERQDIGVTLRVTPQITEGDFLRLQIFQEITNIAQGLAVGDPDEVGVPLTKRTVENTVVVSDHDTVVIGGLIQEEYNDAVNKVPWLGDIPLLGWFFKSTSRNLTKTNLLVFLTPHIVRSPEDLERETIRKRQEFWDRSEEALSLNERERREAERRREQAEAVGLEVSTYRGKNPIRSALIAHEERYPLERMAEIEEIQRRAEEERRRRLEADLGGPTYEVLAAVFRDEETAAETLTRIVDAGFDGALLSSETDGTVLYEIRLGPFDTLDEAETAAAVVRQAFGLAPEVLIRKPEEDAP